MASNKPECEPSPSAKSTPDCQSVLRQHWPDVHVFGDVRELRFGRHLPRPGADNIDVICGGFPCQDISLAGKGAGIEGGRSGLWREYARIIGEVRPRYVIVENVAALLGRGFHEFSGTWPRSGLMRNGIAYQLPPLVPLTDEIGSGLWPTPQAQDFKSGTGYSHNGKSQTPQLRHLLGGLLNPTWVEWLMGFPLGWTALEASAMQSFRRSPKSSGGR